jgi:Lrp/AsnC family transcriptional regulator for asnA, asnC and gidA
MDSLNEGIIRHFWDGRVSFIKVARDLGVAENTIRSRVKRLQRDGIMQIIGLVDPARLPGHSASYFGLKVKADRIIEAADELSVAKGVVAVACVSGRFNILLLGLFNDELTMADFVSDVLGQVEGLIELEAFPVFKGFKFNIRYVL